MNNIPIPENDKRRNLEVEKYKPQQQIDDEDLDFLSAMAAEICGTPSALITLIGQNTQYIKSAYGMDLETREFPREFTFCAHTISSPEGFMVVEDAREDQRFKNNPFVTGESPILSYAGVSLSNSSGYSIGSLCTIDFEPKSFSEEQIEKLQKVANQVMKSIELSRKTNELKQLNENLLREQTKYNFIIEGTETSTFDWDIVNDQMTFSDVWFKISGYSRSDFPNQMVDAWRTIVHPDDLQQLQQQVQLHFDGKKKKFSSEFRIKHKNGEYLWISSQGKIFERDASGRPTRMYGLHRDISEKKKVDVEILFREKLLESLYNLSPLGIALNDYETGAFIEVNKRLVEPTGYSQSEFLNLTYFELTPEEYLEMEKEQLKELDATGKYGPYEKEYIRKDGTKYPVLLRGVLAKDPNGKKIIWSFIEDISEQKRNEELQELNLQKIEKLLSITEKQNDRLKNFAHIVSHNLRSHSSGISLLLDFLSESNPEIKVEEPFKHLKTASGNLESTIHDLNDIVKVNVSGQEDFQMVQLKAAVDKIVESVEPLTKAGKVEISADVHESVNIYGLRAYIESILLNMVTNGIKYSSPDRDSIIRISAKEDIQDNLVIIEIEDNGIGIDLDTHRKDLFKMYKIFHKHEDARGVGLFLVKNQVENMNGSIDIESTVDVGTKFIIKLPNEQN
ncbi:PAS domain S-box-containing protein [Gramella sp. Hel_I_59]|uniref:PAS domain-containing protein n=1 Tax=Gramella sp. Hel_I_59 TaxID=1249978 RepID=UPI00115220EF|nr:PAS domain-containing protein [Gramella sp. Hel_I_59]TQI69276.1 PAS domain S-box-containing protein [Gramella sp. Hel_I_59]